MRRRWSRLHEILLAAYREFEERVKQFFGTQGIHLRRPVTVAVGVRGTKPHKFDLGSDEQRILVECKSHTWTETDNMPSAKMKDWNEAMYLFHAAPGKYRKLFVVLRAFSEKRQETLAAYYMRTNGHLIPEDVEIWE